MKVKRGIFYIVVLSVLFSCKNKNKGHKSREPRLKDSAEIEIKTPELMKSPTEKSMQNFISIAPGVTALYYSYLGDIFVVNVLENKPTEKQPLNFINTEFDEVYPSVSPDGSILYFASNRDGGFGGYDIYKVLLDKHDSIINLGPAVNTIHDETMPYISADGERFYYCSKGHNSIGGLDVFLSEVKRSGYGIAEPMSDINTEKNDFLYTYFLNEGTAIVDTNLARLLGLKSAIVVNTAFKDITIAEHVAKHGTPKKELKNFLEVDLNNPNYFDELLDVMGNTTIEGIHYELQIGASTNELTYGSAIEQHGNVIVREAPNNIKRYSLGKFSTLSAVERVRKSIYNNGFTDAFLVCYSQNEKVSLKDVVRVYLHE